MSQDTRAEFEKWLAEEKRKRKSQKQQQLMSQQLETLTKQVTELQERLTKESNPQGEAEENPQDNPPSQPLEIETEVIEIPKLGLLDRLKAPGKAAKEARLAAKEKRRQPQSE